MDLIGEHYNCSIIRSWKRKWDDDKGKSYKTFQLKVIGSLENREIVIDLYQTCIHKFRVLAIKRYLQYKKDIKEGVVEAREENRLDSSGIGIKWLEASGYLESKGKYISSYCVGAIKGLNDKLREETTIALNPAEQDKWGLIVIKHDALIKQYKEDHHPDLKGMSVGFKSDLHDYAYTEGVKDGKSNHTHKMLE